MKYIVLDNKVPAKIDLFYTKALNKYLSHKAKFRFIARLKGLGYKVAFMR